MKTFLPADILLPKSDFEKFAVVACDQYTSEPEYWTQVEKTVGNAPSAFKITLPEIYLSDKNGIDERISKINITMREYLDGDVFNEFRSSVIYTERTLCDGRVRHGIVGAIDLEDYDYHKGSKKLIRATEGTVLERIPPRVKIRRNAPLELPHVMLLIDDPENTVIGKCSDEIDKKLYNFELMQGGGHIKGGLVSDVGKKRINAALEGLVSGSDDPLLFAVGDGNHSLATAKECYEMQKKQLAEGELSENLKSRYALVEIVNIHDPSLVFEPIYRVVFGVDSKKFIGEMKQYFDSAEIKNGSSSSETILMTKPQTVEYCSESISGKYVIKNSKHKLTVGSVQAFLDEYLKSHPDTEVDYIHGEETVKKLCAQNGVVGLIFDGMGKDQLFDAIRADGVLPRKTFSMGEAADKRYYIECRKIR